MSPLSEADGAYGIWQCNEIVPCGAGDVDNVLEVVEHGVGQPVGAKKLPDIFDRVQFGGAGWQEDQAEIARQSECGGRMP